MNKLILFCVETNQQANTDYPYIRGTIKRFYEDNNKIVMRPIFLKSKTRYKDHAVINKIESQKNGFPNKDVTVIYCIDVDDYDTSAETKRLLDDIKRYCISNHYEFVFFCRDVEDVYWGKQVSKNDKIRMAASFNEKHQINSIKESQLRKAKYTKNCSNILSILDKYLTKKG